jgi:cephalosporin hydroxylase
MPPAPLTEQTGGRALKYDLAVAKKPQVPIEDRLDQPLREYFIARASSHFEDSYMGVPMAKFPEDLRIYEHLLWESRANVVIEVGAWQGGSALWFRDRLLALNRYRQGSPIRVVSIDIETTTAEANLSKVDPNFADTITLLRAGVADPGLVDEVHRHLPPGARCLVSEDSAHIYETTQSALVNFAPFVPVGRFFVVGGRLCGHRGDALRGGLAARGLAGCARLARHRPGFSVRRTP